MPLVAYDVEFTPHLFVAGKWAPVAHTEKVANIVVNNEGDQLYGVGPDGS